MCQQFLGNVASQVKVSPLDYMPQSFEGNQGILKSAAGVILLESWLSVCVNLRNINIGSIDFLETAI